MSFTGSGTGVCLTNDGLLVMTTSHGRFSTSRIGQVDLLPDETLESGECLRARDVPTDPRSFLSSRAFRACMQLGGNFVTYRPEGTSIFYTATFGYSDAGLTQQPDANLVVHSKEDVPFWHSSQTRSAPSNFVLPPDGNRVKHLLTGRAAGNSQHRSRAGRRDRTTPHRSGTTR